MSGIGLPGTTTSGGGNKHAKKLNKSFENLMAASKKQGH
jgi:hypothetical protein